MNKKQVVEYLKTVVITLITAIVFVTGITILIKETAHKRYLSMPKAQTVRSDKTILLQMIAKYEKAAIQNPSDYTLNTKLGNLYEILGDDADASKNYRNAVAKSPYGVYSTYFDLADFHIKTGRLSKAEEIVKEIKVNKRNTVLQSVMGDFYVHLGDAYSDYQDFELALNQYETARKYYKMSRKSERDNIAVERILEAYDNLASKNIEKKKLTSAIENLETALKYEDLPVTNYKLAILYKDIDPLIAYKYIKKTYDTDPGIINFNIYEKILLDVMKFYENTGNYDLQEFYKHKLKIIKKFKQRYIIAPEDFGVEVLSTRIIHHLFGNGKTVIIKFRIKNLTDTNVNTAFLGINAVYNSKSVHFYNKKLFSKKNPLRPMAESEPITITYSFDDSINTEFSDDIKFTFRLSKKENVRKILIYTLDLHK